MTGNPSPADAAPGSAAEVLARFPAVAPGGLPKREQEVLERWQRERTFQRCNEARRDAPTFVFYEGPPTANGTPGIHHVLGRTLKDTVCRYRSMKGCRVERKAGWDTHGLPVEIEIEKELGLSDRTAIERYGIAAFNRACRESVLRYKRDWDRLTRRIGYWVDLDAPYITFDNRYIESIWWIVKRLHQKGLLYRGHKIQWYSPGSGTVLSSHEVSLGYREVEDPGAFVRFRQAGRTDASFLVWTTTPWTLPANAALAVGPDIRYVKVQVGTGDERETLILAEERLGVLMGDYRVSERCSGRELAGMRSRPLFPPAGQRTDGWRVVTADFVATGEGTGIVHVAPAFGADDYDTGRRERLPLLKPVDEQGRFTGDVALVAGLWFKDADRKLLDDLRRRGLLYKLESYRHNYPFDWRRDTPLLNYPMDSWFVRTTALRERLVELNRAIHWHPRAIGERRFGNWLAENVDWAISRRRFWGTPLPIWTAGDPDRYEVIGSLAELRERCSGQLPGDLDLHRPWVDELTWPAEDGGTMCRVPDVIDVWFDSGAMPYAQWHYPFENEEAFACNFPADFIAEGVDQTRGWFYTLHALAAAVSDNVAYRNVMVNGLVLDERGEKMSKSRGNVADPFSLLEEHGADVLRWYLAGSSPPWENLRFRAAGPAETQRKFFGTVENVYSFFAAYANIDGFSGAESAVPVAERNELDRWIVSRLHNTAAKVDDAFDGYDTHRAAQAMESFVEDLSNWYIRRSRTRFWRARKGRSQGGDPDKLAAYQTACECLYTLARLMAPLAPFFAEWLYRCLNDALGRYPERSVHLTDFPRATTEYMDPELERRMALARGIVSTVLLLRNRSRINVRRPLARVLLVASRLRRSEIERMERTILDEINVQRIEYVEDAGQLIRYSLRPNFRALGPRLGRRLPLLQKALAALDEAAIRRCRAGEGIELEIGGERVRLEASDVEVRAEAIGKWQVTQEGEVTVALDTELTPELLAGGLARESAHRIQNLRKKHDLALTDRIRIEYHATEALDRAIRSHADWIRRETLALELRWTPSPCGDCTETFEIDAEKLRLAIAPVRLPSAEETGGKERTEK